MCGAFAAWLVLWAALDRRPPNDHDDFYTHRSIPAAFEAHEAGPVPSLGVLARHFRDGTLHPQLAQTSLVAALGTFGISRFVLRAANAPWLFLLLFGTFLLARELSGPRLALLAVFIVGTLPIVLNYSRKWDIQFHAACLVPLGLWLGIRALRATHGAGRWWLAFGAWQGLRAYSHPILLPDIVVTLGLVGIVQVLPAALTKDLSGAMKRLRPWLGAVAVAALLSIWYTGFLGDWVGEPDFSLRNYVFTRHSYTEGAWIKSASIAAVLRLGADLLRETVWLHLMPGAAFLLLPGLLALPGRILRPPREPITWGIEWMLLGTVLAQIPPAGLAASNRAYFNDWLFVFPTVVVLSVTALQHLHGRIVSERTRRISAEAWVTAVVLNGLFVAVTPVAASLSGPDPLEHPEHYAGLPMELFTHSTSGRHLVTHHMVSTRRLAHSEVAARAREALGPEESNLSVGLLDLTWDPGRYGASGCRLGDPAHRKGWYFGRPEEASPGSEPTISPWPFAFEGFRSLDLVEGRSESSLQKLPRLVLVRLWLEPVAGWELEPHSCTPRDRIPEGFVRMAESLVRGRIGLQVETHVVDDPTGALVGRTIEWVPDPTYLGVTLLVDRGENPAPIQRQDDQDA